MEATSHARPWLHRSRHGYCGETRLNSGCSGSTSGSFTLESRAVRSWNSAVSACLAHCSSCGGCNFISVSLKSSDCSWYQQCPHLRKDMAGFLTGPANTSAPLMPLMRPGVHSAEEVWLAASGDGTCGETTSNTGCAADATSGSWSLRGRAVSST